MNKVGVYVRNIISSLCKECRGERWEQGRAGGRINAEGVKLDRHSEQQTISCKVLCTGDGGLEWMTSTFGSNVKANALRKSIIVQGREIDQVRPLQLAGSRPVQASLVGETSGTRGLKGGPRKT